MPEPQELTVHREENFTLGRLMPQSVRELHWFAGEAAKSGLFKTSEGGNNMRNLEPAEAFMLMSTGIELGLTPLQGLRDLSLIKGKVDVPPSVLAAKIASDPRVTLFDPEGDDKAFEIRAKRSDRDNGCIVRITWDDISRADQEKHIAHAEDFLYARCVRRLVKRYFPDLKYGLASNVVEEPARVIDIAAVERETQQTNYGNCPECHAKWGLVASNNGGAFLSCVNGHTAPPPQEVRDTIRGRTHEFVDMPAPEPDKEGDPTPEQEADLRAEWTLEIIQRLAENMVGTVPHDLHSQILTNWGWKPDVRVKTWLAKMELEELSSFHDDIMSVEV